MRRLQEQQAAILAPADARARGRGVMCAVVCVNGPEVILLPLNATAERSIASLGSDVYLNFRHAGSAIALRGEFEEKAHDDVRFHVTDGVQVNQRRSARHDCAARIELTPDGREAIVAETLNLSADGALCGDGGDLDVGDAAAVRLVLPDERAFVARATVVRRDGAQCAIDCAWSRPDREALLAFVIAEKRRLLQEALFAAMGQRRAA